MARKAQASSGGAPEWVLTYGDMMSLLLCFFIMLTSLSTIKEDEKLKAVMQSLQATFGFFTPKSKVEGSMTDSKSMSLIERIQSEVSPLSKNKPGVEKGQRRESQLGKSMTVTNIRDGFMITVGGLTSFEHGSGELLPTARDDLTRLATLIKGYRNKVMIRGHTSRVPLPKDCPFKDHMELSYARAKAVCDCLVAQGVAADRLNIEACADNEPLKTNVHDEEALARNRRVEVVVKDTMVEDYVGQGKAN